MPMCQDCYRELPQSDFPKNGKDKDGAVRYRSDCKLCYAIKRKGSKKKHAKFCNNTMHRTGETHILTLDDWRASVAYFGGRCMYCGTPASRRVTLTRDHIVPVVRGGQTTKYNIGPACSFCNCSKNGDDMERWYRKQKTFNEMSLIKIKEWSEGHA